MPDTQHEQTERLSWDEMKATRDLLVRSDLTDSSEYQRELSSIRVGRLIYDLRTQAEVTQVELAKRMHSTQPHIAKLESGRAAPTLDTLQRVASALNRKFVLGMVSDEEWESNDSLHQLEDSGHMVASA